MNEGGPRVAVTIPTLAGGSALETCLRALERQVWRDFEVIVIDNGSNAPVAVADFAFPLRVLRPGFNLGFGGAINLAVGASSAGMIAVLNDDTEADEGWLEELVREMECDPGIGMCASNIRLWRSGRMDSAGMSICLDGSSKQRGGSMAPELFERSEYVLFPSACAALYRRALLEDVGMFDSDFFLYCEDTDIGLRALWAGWRCRYAAGARVRHLYSSTAKPHSVLKAAYVERNRLWVILKNFPAPLLVVAPFASVLRYGFQLRQSLGGSGAAAEFIRSGVSFRSALGILVRAHVETLRNLPLLWRKRMMIRRKRRIGAVQFIRLVLHHRISIGDLARA